MRFLHVCWISTTYVRLPKSIIDLTTNEKSFILTMQSGGGVDSALVLSPYRIGGGFPIPSCDGMTQLYDGIHCVSTRTDPLDLGGLFFIY